MDKSACTDSSQCEQVFGSGATCGTDGYCKPPPVGVDAPSTPDARAGNVLELADYCRASDNVPAVVAAQNENVFVIDTTQLGDGLRQPACLSDPDNPGTQWIGNDGFFAVDMKAGERWHFHANVTPSHPDADPALYILRPCDERSCELGEGIDDCREGGNEHLSYVPKEDGVYLIGIDSRAAGGAVYELEVIKPDCGNGVLEHSESCDDGDRDPGDGCEQECRKELTPDNRDEEEPNDDYTGANVLVPEPVSGELVVRGFLAGICDFDMFGFNVLQGGAVDIELLDPNGAPCGTNVPNVIMQLVNRDGITVRGQGAKRDGINQCPVLDGMDTFTRSLDGGLYFVRIGAATGDEARFNYQLRIKVLPPPTL